MVDFENARDLLAKAEKACIAILGPNVSVVTEHIYKALNLAEGLATAVETPTESDEVHAAKAQAALDALNGEVKAGIERQAKAQEAFKAIMAKGGENASILANKAYLEILNGDIANEAGVDNTEAESNEDKKPKGKKS